jgi:hypothetical protein
VWQASPAKLTDDTTTSGRTAVNPYFAAEHNRLRHEDLLREAATRAPRSGRREPRRARRGRHRER